VASKCFSCNQNVDVFMDSALVRPADFCADCLLPNMTWADLRCRPYFFTKQGKIRLISLKLIAHRMVDYNKKMLDWEEKYGKPYGLDTFPKNVVREKKHMSPDWFPELHEICHLA
jgi:hypothetical protein